MARRSHLIALTGYAGVGKDTVADLLVTHLGFRKLAFGDALRAEVAEGFGIELAYLTHPSTKHLPVPALAMRKAPLGFVGAVALSIGNEGRTPAGMLSDAWLDQPRTPRQILQWWGTEYRRTQQPQYWTRQLTARAHMLASAGEDRLVVTDCRFENEAACIRALGGEIWQVVRPGIDGTNTAEGNHVSATDGRQFGPTAVINNRHDIAHLQRVVLDEFITLETGVPAPAQQPAQA
ncbi:AAA family ATPase [uncultured Pseudacidovorax sp.]|uniref:AAA family ATPase n=1 Tax=uncultured Pseudacidovorax sp. TaxID=679313 RepID=UPI0025CE4033|nr:AAA family ATPase [uncultured Pseudacidovorax sp.]